MTSITVIRRRHRWVLLWAQEGRCAACGDPCDIDAPMYSQDEPTIDHVFPRSQGGHNGIGNKLVKHRRCNERKGDRMPTVNDQRWLYRVEQRLKSRPRTIAECEIRVRAMFRDREAAAS